MTTDIQSLLGDKADSLLGFNSPKIPKERLHLPSPDFVDRIVMQSECNNRTLDNLTWMNKNEPNSLQKPKKKPKNPRPLPNRGKEDWKFRTIIFTLAVAALAIVLKVFDPAVWGFLGTVAGYTMAKK